MRAALVVLLFGALGGAQAEAMSSDRTPPDGVIVFEQRSATWSPKDAETIDQLATQAKANPANWVVLEAYTNDFGGSEMNLALGQRRVDSIERQMALQGVPAHRIRGTSYRDEHGNDGHLPLHRVEIRIEQLGR
jgi:outer membrane protein OmpA-like peptidoglycan-associated protein